MTAIATLTCSLEVYCPKCNESIDLLEDDCDYIFSTIVFSKNLDDLKGQEAICPNCDHEFNLTGVEY